MIDLHTHTFCSDGCLGPGELARRAQAAGYQAIGLTDHADASTLENCLAVAVKAARSLNGALGGFAVFPGVELTHVPPAQIGALVRRARELGAAYVVVHGESIVEPVAPGTNRAAIEGGADILAHPGLISEEEMALAAAKGVLVEITTHKRHSLANGHVARLAGRVGAQLVLNNDAHEPADLVSPDMARKIVLGAGLSLEDFEAIRQNALNFTACWRRRP